MYNKYGNVKVVVNGRKFDSKHEAKRYSELLLLQRAGKIRDLKCQVVFELIPPQYDTRTHKCIERNCYYRADFVYTDENGEQVVEDAKGFKSKDYIIKRKLMLWLRGIKIKEV